MTKQDEVLDLTGASVDFKQDLTDRALDKGDLVIHPANGSSKRLNDLDQFGRLRRKLEE